MDRRATRWIHDDNNGVTHAAAGVRYARARKRARECEVLLAEARQAVRGAEDALAEAREECNLANEALADAVG